MSLDFKARIERLEGSANWTRWKREVTLMLRHHDVLEIVTGQEAAPQEPLETSEAARNQYVTKKKAYQKSDDLVQLIIVNSLNDEHVDMTSMCDTAKATWDKLISIYEQSSGQRIDRLMELFFTSERLVDETIAIHVGRLQRNFRELNDELKKLGNAELPEILLTSRIISTLPSQYFEFKSVWESISVETRTVNLLLERLRLIEQRLPAKNSETEALLAKSRFKKKNESKTKENIYKKERKCYFCHEVGHYGKECPEKLKKKKQTDSKKESKAAGDAFVAIAENHNENAFYISEESVMEQDIWLADSGASTHMTNCEKYFSTYEAFITPKTVQVGNKEVILAYGKGIINVEMNVKGKWYRNHLLDVWYVPEIGRNLFSISQNIDRGFSFKADKRGCIFVKNGHIRLVGKRTSNRLYALQIRVLVPEEAAEVHLAATETTLQLWHERLGHQAKSHVKRILQSKGIKVTVDNEFCEGCVLGKASARASFKDRQNRPTQTGELIHADVCGPMQEPSVGGSRYFVCFKDDFSKYRRVFFLKEKSEVVRCLSVFLNEANVAGHTVKELLCDGGKEFDNKEVKEILESKGINFRKSMPYTPEQNGAAERENRTLVESSRTMIHTKDLPIKLWAEAVNTAAYILNHTGPTPVKEKSPIELWDKRSVNFDHLKVFGTECFIHLPKQKRQKFDRKSNKGYLVGYCGEKDGYRVWLPASNKIECSRNIIFKSEILIKKKPELIVNSIASTKNDTKPDDNEDLTVVKCRLQKNDNDTEVESDENNADYEDATEENEDEEELNISIALRRGKREIRKPDKLSLLAEADLYVMEDLSPQTYNSAMKSDEAQEWQKAMDDEMASLIENDTWQLVSPPKGKKIVQNRWVLRVKTKADGTLDRFKARLVAKGYTQKTGIDYDETFSPVARYDTVRAVLSVAASEGLKLLQFDVETAFLHGELKEEVYMKQPEGYDDGTGRVCRLKRSLYGLKQAPRCWNRRFVNFIKKQEMKCSSADSCLFTRERNGKKLIVIIYVDDGLVAGTDEKEIDNFMRELQKEFKVTIGSLDSFLGIQVQQMKNGSIFITQRAYAERILNKFGMTESRSVSTPIEGQIDQQSEAAMDDQIPYRQAVGSLMYLVMATRPDLAYALSIVSAKLDSPSQADWKAVKRIYRYLKGTTDYGLLFQRNCEEKKFQVFTDSDFAGESSTRHSRTGIVSTHSGAAISWLSQKQRCVTLSSTEAEYVAASEGTKELIWLKRLLEEITKIDYTPTLKIDNAGAIKLAKNPEFHKRTKHVEVKYHFIREKYQEGVIGIEHVSTEDMAADIMTKPLGRQKFEKFRNWLGLIKEKML